MDCHCFAFEEIIDSPGKANILLVIDIYFQRNVIYNSKKHV